MVFVVGMVQCCNPFATYSQFVRHIVAIRSPRIRRMFATLLQSVCHAFAECRHIVAIRSPRFRYL